jgi:hypothetical protein
MRAPRPLPTKSKLADLVDRGELRFISTGGLSFGGDNSVSSIVAQVCTAVPASNWGGNTPMSGVYDCQGKGTDIRNAADTPPAATNLPRVPGGGLPGGGGFPGGGQPGSGGLPGGIPANLTPEQMQFGMCVLQHGGNPQDLLGIASGGKPSAQTEAAIDQCGGLPPGPPPSIGPPPQGP